MPLLLLQWIHARPAAHVSDSTEAIVGLLQTLLHVSATGHERIGDPYMTSRTPLLLHICRSQLFVVVGNFDILAEVHLYVLVEFHDPAACAQIVHKIRRHILADMDDHNMLFGCDTVISPSWKL